MEPCCCEGELKHRADPRPLAMVSVVWGGGGGGGVI